MRSDVGVLKELRVAAVLLGLVVALLGALAAAGLCLLMILGLSVGVRIHEAPRLMLPAAALGGLIAVLVVLFLSP